MYINPKTMKRFNFREVKVYYLLAMGMAIFGMCRSADAQQAELIPVPQALEVAVGDTFQVNYLVYPVGQPLAVVDMHLNFDPAFLSVLNVVAAGESNFNVLQPIFDNVTGTVDISAFQLGEDFPQEAFELVEVTFLALSEVPLTQAFHPNNVFPRTILAFAGNEVDSYYAPLDVSIHSNDPLSTENMDVSGLVFDLWPNPTSEKGFAMIGSTAGGEVTLSLFDLTGKIVAQYFHGNLLPGMEQVIELDLQEFSAGVYLCQLKTTQGTVSKRLALTR